MFTFSVVDLFLLLLIKKSMWHFGVTWLISQLFPCRDFKPVAFLIQQLSTYVTMEEVLIINGLSISTLSSKLGFGVKVQSSIWS